jgi:glycosyltransferase involved in cell wall biosynthesis
MNVLYFSRDYTVHDRRFLAALAQTRHQVSFLRLEQSANSLPESTIPAGIKSITWPGGQLPGWPANQSTLLKDFGQVIDQVQPDLVQAGPLHLAANLVARSAFKPLVSMSWGYDLLYDAPRDPAVQQAIRFTLSQSAAMIGDCNTIRQLAISLGMPGDRIITFPWGIDLDEFSPAVDLHLPSQPFQSFTLLSTRGWEPIYGIEVIAQAFVNAAKIQPELRLVMLGNGSQASQVRQILQDGGVLEKVSFPGQAAQADLPQYYRSSHLYISASHSDGTSISLLEALACGTPVLVSDIPGNREWVEPGVNGWLYPDGDAAALANSILFAGQHRHRLAEMGQSARKLAEARADWCKNFPGLLKAYHLALDTNLPTFDLQTSASVPTSTP